MKDTTKIQLKNGFASLIKNDAAIECAKTAPWWIAIILFVLGSFLPIIPIMVNTNKTYGASFISGNTYGFEQAIAECSNDLKTKNYSFKVEDKQLVEYIDGVAQSETWNIPDGEENPLDLTPVSTYKTVIDGNTNIALNVYYTSRPFSSGEYTVKKLVTEIEKQTYVLNTDSLYNAETYPDVDAKNGVYMPSYILLYSSGIYGKLFKTGTTTAASASYSGLDWENAEFTGDLIDAVINVEGVEINTRNVNYVNGVLANWKTVFNNAYKNQRVKTFWMTSGIYYGIYLVLGLFMGLMMFLLTRGKNNPNRNYTFWLTFKIACWIIPSPAILAMILGFVWSAAAGLGFIVLIGLRTMWLSMRQLNPAAQQR